MAYGEWFIRGKGGKVEGTRGSWEQEGFGGFQRGLGVTSFGHFASLIHLDLERG